MRPIHVSEVLVSESDLTRLLVEQAGNAGPLLLVGWWVARRLAEVCQHLGDAVRALVRGPHEIRIVHVLAGELEDTQVRARVRELLAALAGDADPPSPSVRDPPGA